MKREYLGDSYDAVKRLWQQALAEWATLYAEPRFLPAELREDFTRLTGIPLLGAEHPPRYSILNDPDTGIRLPQEANQGEGRSHVTIDTIVRQLREQGPRCVITFDQSDYRNSDLRREEQRRAKMGALRGKRLPCFYYVSHAPFLFAFSTTDARQELLARLIGAGIPADRFQGGEE